MKQHKGSITVFALLAMLLVMATLFSLLEFGRFHQIKKLAKLQTESAVESAFAAYSSHLWQEYHLLGCEKQRISEIVQTSGNSRQNSSLGRRNLFLFQVKDAELEEYTLLTDGNGTAYIQAVASYMKTHILYETVNEMLNQYENVKHIMQNNGLDISTIDTALEELEKAKQQNVPSEETNKSYGTSIQYSKNQKEKKENILTEIQKLQKKGILELVLKDTESVSEQTISLADAVSSRILEEGSQTLEEVTWVDKIWLQQYVLSAMSYFGNQKESHSMSYEIEYLLGGKAQDYENLKAVVTQLLLIREAANFLYLMSDVSKVEEAAVLAGVIAGFSQNPLLVEAVKSGILAAWAFGESILDVRALLQQKKIPLIKNESLWTLQLENLTDISEGFLMAKESDGGLSYKDYLGILLLLAPEKEIAMRGMDLQEVTLQNLYKNPEIRMDNFVIKAKVKVSYTYSFIFPLLDMVKNRWKDTIFITQEFGYG